jgi:hypothetical protein
VRSIRLLQHAAGVGAGGDKRSERAAAAAAAEEEREGERERDEGSARPHGWAGIRPSPSYLQTFFIFLPLLFFFLVFFPCNSFARSRIIFFQIVAAHTGIPVYLFNAHDKHAHFLIFRGFVSKNIFTERI